MPSYQILAALDRLRIELAASAFVRRTGCGESVAEDASNTLAGKLQDAGFVQQLTGACPTVALDALADVSPDEDPATVAQLAGEHGLQIGTLVPNLRDQEQYAAGSLCNASDDVCAAAMEQIVESIEFGESVGASCLALSLPDGTNYPGQDNFFRRKQHLADALHEICNVMAKRWPAGTLLIEPSDSRQRHHADLADWGMAYVVCRQAGLQAKLLVDVDHSSNRVSPEHIVAFLLDEGFLGGVRIGGIRDPFALFRVFDQIAQFEFENDGPANIGFCLGRLPDPKPRLEGIVQAVCEAQPLFAKAQLIDRKALSMAQRRGDAVAAEGILRSAFHTDVSSLLDEWRRQNDVPLNPLAEVRERSFIARLADQQNDVLNSARRSTAGFAPAAAR
jgi:L-rhamnose isomerase / sugar isomerase